MAETITIRGEGISVDLLLWRRYGVPGRALVETTLTLNPGLADAGAVLPLGSKVILPELPRRDVAVERKVVTLFG
ncbi:tail protein X [Afifella sp. H1R]|uniref:tail protein X n=1 Tax=Afifella sp. H1R TaxID=2908841 RepID=UPI001F2F24E2|nr:tail protein X [Afifella sp. H1R]MCF1502893.1 tail protein X [Afifella sp. H1R]